MVLLLNFWKAVKVLFSHSPYTPKGVANLKQAHYLMSVFQGTVLFFAGAASANPLAFPDGPGGPGPLPIPRPGSDGSYAGDNYFQYINVPAHKTFEWGYRRGNPEHNREEYLSQKDHTFKAKVSFSLMTFLV